MGRRGHHSGELEKPHLSAIERMGTADSLGMLLRYVQARILKHHANDITVDRDAFSKCWFPRHPRRGRF